VLTGIIAVAIGLGVMVLVHEWGHFVIARLFGVRVEVFSIGFGTRLFGIKRGPTDYRLSALPLGGYVRMAGDNPAEERRGDPDEFLSKPRWQRVLIALAGPTTNFLLAVALTAGLFVTSGEIVSYAEQPVIVGGVLRDSVAEKAGIQAGDRIVSFGSVRNPTWERLLFEIGLSTPGQSEPVTIERDGRLITTRVSTELQPFAVVGYPAEPVIVGSVAEGSPAEHGGLKEGDVIVAANGQRLAAPPELPEILKQNGGQTMTLEVVRQGQVQELEIHPTWKDPGDGAPRWQIGITFRPATSSKRFSVPQALTKATEFHIVLAKKLVSVVWQLLSRQVSMKQLQGPLGIVQETSRAAKRGFGDVVNLMALISLNLAILNLLPIPILDGGHILMLSIEGLLRRDLSLKIKERFVTVGMVFLLLVFLIVMYNDVLRLFPNH
jgi:regulator of sigma E protease